ncbi:(2Fe-2S) ferredoxin domain-containing protein [Phytoactinopolyspora halotolerans]|uniref:(2Fe-2S) ferredoxin domain-containing protein n=1 Tax=Phytoactinopolyspora halotolerans TaxID=1981512 RepID=A0A6L9S0H4_9ACTN|nr:(2Fe-2S) ferredoxin domain-containing protein [Phytoactinopolyspora halotolerans]NED98622.1 hypothetical protein [Phytoactinopolyspora halotolerans]
MSREIVLVGRALGAPSAERALGDLASRLAERLNAQLHLDVRIDTAMLDHGERSLHDALDGCLDSGADHVLVVPVQIPRDRYLETWTAKAIAHWRERGAARVAGARGAVPDVRIAAPVSQTAELVQALCAVVDGPSRAVTESPESFRSPSWSDLGEHRHHVLVCRGPRCSSHGSPAVADALGACLRDGPVGYDDVLVTNTGCLVPCNLGPIVVVQPDDVWYTSVDADAVRRIVDDHLAGGRVVEDLCTPRSRRSAPHETPVEEHHASVEPPGQRHQASMRPPEQHQASTVPTGQRHQASTVPPEQHHASMMSTPQENA